MGVKVVFFEIEPWEIDYLKEKLSGIEASFFEESLSLKNIESARGCQVVSTFTDSQINKEVLEKLPDLKLITTRSTGFDHIDIETAKNLGIAAIPYGFFLGSSVEVILLAIFLHWRIKTLRQP